VIEQALATLAIAVTVALAAAFLARPVLRRLPEPADGDDKPLYRELGSTTFLVSCGVLAGIAAALSWLSLPRYAQPPWSVLAILGILLAAIDARTSWLPLRLTQAAWLAMIVASLLAAVLGGDPGIGLRAAAGAAIAGGTYLLVWLILLLGTLAGGLVGLARLARGRRDAFPYAPSMLAGAYAACVVALLT
jgi:leader peptidase (prepilin peptidase)/N-methyltransferase